VVSYAVCVSWNDSAVNAEYKVNTCITNWGITLGGLMVVSYGGSCELE